MTMYAIRASFCRGDNLSVARRTCPSRITTQHEELLQQTAGYNHSMDAADCQVQAIRIQMRKRACEKTTPVPAIYNEQLISLNTHPERNSITPKLPSLTSLKSSLHRNRCSRLPLLPKIGDQTKTLIGENLPLRDDGDSNT